MRFPAVVAAVLALGAFPAIAASTHEHEHAGADCCRAAIEADADTPFVSSDGFEYVGGEAPWRLAQHKFEFADGSFRHALDCPVVIARIKAEDVSRQTSN